MKGQENKKALAVVEAGIAAFGISGLGKASDFLRFTPRLRANASGKEKNIKKYNKA
jgi:hypothetical protein